MFLRCSLRRLSSSPSVFRCTVLSRTALFSGRVSLDLNETYRPRRLTNAEVENNKLSLKCEDIITKLGIGGLSLDEFIQRYGSNN